MGRVAKTLKELQLSQNITQIELGEALGISQSAISKKLNATDMPMSSLRELVELMGGSLFILVQIGDKEIELCLEKPNAKKTNNRR